MEKIREPTEEIAYRWMNVIDKLSDRELEILENVVITERMDRKLGDDPQL